MSSTSAKTTAMGGVAVLAGGLALLGYATVDTATQLDKVGKIVMATGNDDYYRLATSYKNDLQKFGVTVDLRQDTEGFSTQRDVCRPCRPSYHRRRLQPNRDCRACHCLFDHQSRR
mgnify:CR=1 FL=1